jgi:hypothetical protein
MEWWKYKSDHQDGMTLDDFTLKLEIYIMHVLVVQLYRFPISCNTKYFNTYKKHLRKYTSNILSVKKMLTMLMQKVTILCEEGMYIVSVKNILICSSLWRNRSRVKVCDDQHWVTTVTEMAFSLRKYTADFKINITNWYYAEANKSNVFLQDKWTIEYSLDLIPSHESSEPCKQQRCNSIIRILSLGSWSAARHKLDAIKENEMGKLHHHAYYK